ncbi:hypothetical protein PtA15_9A62 [Puccinia triticina]|uniref:RRM domain-containing protein n=1 Tax=Puccinia triticina TaxID=208348 RepID=A0ABY7CRP1_9BASI|nr:uncharacterized protein PtA15_9A62 [Puccinia triticina]WAQ87938.1 hypothetical protein PtA15_9A62 [Puccinia triticina]
MAPKNKKGQKVLLTDFLADTSTGRSWADEMDELPTAPAPRDPNEPQNSGLGGSHLSRGDGNRYGDRDQYRRGGDRDGMERPNRVEVPIPDKPPYNAFVGNLSWEIGTTELEEFFGPSHITSIRLITDSATGKPKGYGYIEFDDRDALVAATDKSGRELGGRPVRVSVAEPPKEREDRTGGAWRREGPLPTFDDNRRTRHSSHQERSSIDDVDRGERMGFGSNVSNWRRAKPVEPEASPKVPPTAPPTRRKLELSARTVTSSDGTLTPPASLATNKPSPFGAAKPIDTTEREKAIQEKLDRERAELAAGNAKKPTTNPDEKAAPEVESKVPSVATTAAPKAPKPNPFGAAKPVDTLQKELEVEQKLEKEKALLEEKLKKEAQEAKSVPSSISTNIRGPPHATAPESSTTTTAANHHLMGELFAVAVERTVTIM